MDITNYSMHKINDPTGIMIGDRYEFLLDIEVDEDDELYTATGLEVRVILAVDENGARLASYSIIDKQSRDVLEFGLEEEEEEEVLAFCKEKAGN
ncbi:DUF6509 family protein [Planococcus salinus]|uniref:Pullulanase n=1 Tax=Planococcus salinus TaxID=1848460 RepID=A0A3M8P658_9BACL|nr:DUF6509 family protein [Planococcus salinus]RNF38694.1 pullulanase [Planococcus salinus]